MGRWIFRRLRRLLFLVCMLVTLGAVLLVLGIQIIHLPDGSELLNGLPTTHALLIPVGLFVLGLVGMLFTGKKSRDDYYDDPHSWNATWWWDQDN